MEINKKILSEVTKDFKKTGLTSAVFIRRKHKISLEMSIMIRDTIEKRFPNLWKKGKIKYGMDKV